MAENDIIPQEICAIQEFLCNLIRLSDNKEHLNTILITILRIPQETLELTQVQVWMMDTDSRFKKLEKEQAEIRKDLRIIKWAAAAIAAGAPAVQIIMQVLGWA